MIGYLMDIKFLVFRPLKRCYSIYPLHVPDPTF